MTENRDGETPTFDALPLSAEVRKAVDDLGYVHPTPVQLAVFEPASRGRDLVVQARTGTGKTAAFGLPLVDSLVRRGVEAVQALVLCPTRELALQVMREVEALAKHRGVKCAAVYGGAPMPKQVAEIRAGAQVVVGTPGRVLDHLHRGTIDPQRVRTLVLDESDEMLSMGFLPQITDILSFMPESRQTLLFSATLPPDIRRVAETRLKNPEFLTLSGDHIGALEINHYVYLVPRDKVDALVQVIETEDPESAIIFCNTRDETKRVAQALEQQGYAADWLNADLAQNDREKVMAATRSGALRFLVATDVASRGIDISHLTHVINHDFPESAEAYVHRTGRTGRAGRTGTAISLIGPKDVGNLYLLRLTYKLRPIERKLPSALDLKTRQETDLLRLFEEGFASRRPHPEDLALARRLLTHDSADVILAGLLRDHLGVRPEAVEEAKAARRARSPERADTPPPARQERPRSERREERPRDERPRDERPRDERPRDERPRDERPRDERPRDERPRDERGASDERPREERDAGADRPRDERPRGERSRGRRPEPRRRPEPQHGPETVGSVQIQARMPELEPASEAVEPTRPAGEVDPVAAAPVVTLERNGSDVSEAVAASSEDALPEGVAEIYVSVGRRDGAKPSDYETLLERAGLSAQTDYVRVRHRHAFVGVKSEHFVAALAALQGATIAGKRAEAERARRN
jgi:ATP-dependent RNA helicase DeaD